MSARLDVTGAGFFGELALALFTRALALGERFDRPAGGDCAGPAGLAGFRFLGDPVVRIFASDENRGRSAFASPATAGLASAEVG